MSNNQFQLNAVNRSAEQQGKGASRRLRKQNLVPAIIYGGNEEPTAIAVKYNELIKALENEAFFSHILTINVDGDEHQAVIKDLQRHPAKGVPLHADFMRIVKGQKIHMNVPVHFEGKEDAPGTKEGGILSTLVTDVEIICLPSRLPESLVVDVSKMQIGDTYHLSDIVLPEGVVIYELEQEDGTDRTIVNMQAPTVEEVDEVKAEDADVAVDSDDIQAQASDDDNDEA
ncbi:50S ribosomal protein L25/general stress protein Ctc [Moraxella lincolnii]|uniref:Large ribosomal subunit protein bL25 n=1 Tax=Lwoffella lincolnii TaxID=90241 RepID=A0A1T0CEF9_9GAMM|nr:50S ribosomal protein L25/general stress protein Ctc [Moraxella lincolnii]OOS20737.1 50S ribosomal protein L25/general stress protein Ctc [Moraxella lincolnii]